MTATSFLSTANTFTHLTSLTPTSSSSSFCLKKHNVTQHLVCKASSSSVEHVTLSKRSFAMSISSVVLLSLAGRVNATPLEAEDDLELLEKVKQDRKKRLERQSIINSSVKEKGYLQEVVYKLSEVGQAIEKDDFNAASSVLGSDWISKANSAFGKLTESAEEKAEADAFNASISELKSSVSNKDVELAKLAFVSSAVAFEKWTTLTGLNGQLKGL
ncbi:thylakoid lumenal 16.5 kDa protein, chloroplastic [Silene latifolia]|uniref:thylakoid lumenal 16.5 kDa protein, chloroplastic n=1 Tax=Silene latifolia TaxID=37657 RepID=UPI003D779407